MIEAYYKLLEQWNDWHESEDEQGLFLSTCCNEAGGIEGPVHAEDCPIAVIERELEKFERLKELWRLLDDTETPEPECDKALEEIAELCKESEK